MKGFIRKAAMSAAIAVFGLLFVGLLSTECYAQRNQCNVQSSNQVSSAAAIQNQVVVDQLARLQAQVAAQASTPRVSTATASSGSVAERRALSAPVSAPIAAVTPTVSAVANSSGSQAPPRRGVRGIVDRNRASSVAITRRNGRTVAIAR